MKPSYSNLPKELKALNQWVVYKTQERGDLTTKVPYSPNTNRNASITNSDHWGTFEEAIDAKGYDGIGFVFTEQDPYCGIDLDHCRDSETGKIEEWAQEIIDQFDSYTELSPSGTGVHIIIKGTVPEDGNRKGQIEMYSKDRYFTMSGEIIE